MKSYDVSKNSELNLEEKLEVINDFDLENLESVLTDIQSFPDEYEKQVEIAVYNKLFEYGITSI